MNLRGMCYLDVLHHLCLDDWPAAARRDHFGLRLVLEEPETQVPPAKKDDTPAPSV